MPGRVLAGALLALVLAFPVTATAAGRADPRGIPLLDQRGQPFRIIDLTGKPLLITFIATRCTDACPIANAAFDRLYHVLQRDRIDARLLTVTLDPAYDTPFVMAGFGREFGVDPNRWRFAGGSVPDVRKLLAAFGVVTKADRKGVPDVHTTFVYVLDARMRLHKTLLLSTRLPEDAEAAVRSL